MFRFDLGEKERQDIPELQNCRALVVDDDLQPRTDGNTIWVSLIPALLDKKWEKN